MYFAGEYSKFKEGDSVMIKHESYSNPVKFKIKSVGILGGKLSNHCFIYHLDGENGDKFDIVEQNLITLVV